MPISTVWILNYVQQCYVKWFWNISSLGAPVSWTEVRTGDHTEGNIRALVNVSRSDAGKYKCEASNFCGNDSKSTNFLLLIVSDYYQ